MIFFTVRVFASISAKSGSGGRFVRMEAGRQIFGLFRISPIFICLLISMTGCGTPGRAATQAIVPLRRWC
jgi:hypothetical protein